MTRRPPLTGPRALGPRSVGHGASSALGGFGHGARAALVGFGLALAPFASACSREIPDDPAPPAPTAIPQAPAGAVGVTIDPLPPAGAFPRRAPPHPTPLHPTPMDPLDDDGDDDPFDAGADPFGPLIPPTATPAPSHGAPMAPPVPQKPKGVHL